MNITSPKLLSDLEINSKVIPSIDTTKTIYGSKKLKEFFEINYFGQNFLVKRRQILESLLNNPKKVKSINKKLNIISKLSNSINWLFDNDEKDIKEFYFGFSFFNKRTLLSGKNFLKTFAPSLLIIIYLLVYLILKYYGVNINLINYFKGIYNSYQMFIELGVSLIFSNEYIISFLGIFLSTLYILYQGYSFYNSSETAINHYYKTKDVKNYVSDIRKLLNSIEFIHKKDNFFIKEKQQLIPLLKKVSEEFDPKKIKSFGYILLLKKRVEEFKDEFNKVLQYIGIIDAFIAITKLVKQRGYNFPTFDFQSQKPYIKIDGVYNPYFPTDIQAPNNCVLGENNPSSMIITGANSSGKSTYIKSLMINVLFAQTIGVCCCQKIILTPFANLYTYIDIPNIVRDKESLFEAEIMKCMEICHTIESLPQNLFCFTIIDELFTGTNPKEGIAGSYSICDYLNKFSNNLMIITTHFTELTELGIKQPDKFVNKKFTVTKDNYGNYQKPYTIQDGVSNQFIAIELLKLKGYNNEIVNGALEKLKELNT
mgnify:CR=1 FL=1